MTEPDVRDRLGPSALPLEDCGHPCGYLDGLEAANELWVVDELHPETYHDLMDLGYRRSGHLIYRPKCAECSLCVPLRVPVQNFPLGKSFRRTLRRNSDLHLRVQYPLASELKFDLFQRWKRAQHGNEAEADDIGDFVDFLYESAVETLEIEYRLPDGDRLVAVSLVDVCTRSISSVFHYFDPDFASRGLGTLSALREIELCQRRNIPYYYLGYWVAGAPSMDYKTRFHPYELLQDGRWIPSSPPESKVE